MKNKPAEEKETVENIVADLRDDYLSHTPETPKLEAPKEGKELRTGLGKTRWLNVLAIFVMLVGITAAAYILTLDNTSVEISSNNALVDDIPAEDLPADAEPILPTTTAVPLPDPVIELLPTEQPLTLPEATPLPIPPVSDP